MNKGFARLGKLLLPLLMLAGTAQAELASQTSFKNEVTAYTYDTLGRETKRVYGDGQQVVTTYTPAGQVHTVTDSRGVTTYHYDALDRVIRIDYPGGLFVAYEYDGNGNRTKLITPTGTTVYSYNDNSRLISVTDPDGQVTSYAWDDAGHQTEQHLPNGVGTYRVYDDNGRLGEIRHEKDGQVLAKFSYERDDDGRRTGATEQQLDPATQTLVTRTLAWTYDELGRLTSETLIEGGHTLKTVWAHDEVGNRLSEARFKDEALLGTDRYSYDSNDRLTRAWSETAAGAIFSETTYTYDANGATTKVERTGGYVRTYGYDAAQRLTLVQDSSGQRITYGYDAQGIRIAKAVQQASQPEANGSWHYLLDPMAPFTQIVTTLFDNGSATSTETDYRFGAGRVGELRAGQRLYYGEDGHHSVRLVTDAQGQVMAHLNYEAFGKQQSSVTDSANGSSAANPEFRYTGEQYDAALGEYYLRARTYAAEMGRFVQRDTWEGSAHRPLSLNPYIYAESDPIGGIDPSGYFTLPEAEKTFTANGINFARATAAVVIKPYPARQLSRALLRSQAVGLAAGSALTLLVQACAASRAGCFIDIPVLVTGRELPHTSIHIASAQTGFGQTKNGGVAFLPVLLNRVPRSAVNYDRAPKAPQCDDAARDEFGPPSTCDEYPFATSRQGGQQNYDNGLVSLQLVPRAEQYTQGSLLSWFYRNAGPISDDGQSPESAHISLGIPFMPSLAIDRRGKVIYFAR